MTAFQHNKTLGILHLVYAGLFCFLMISLSILMFTTFGTMDAGAPPEEDFPFPIFAVMMVFFVGMNLLMVAPSFVAGYAFLKRKSWTKSIGLIASILAGLNVPLGAPLCVYTLWFLFGEHGRLLYDKQAQALPPASPVWAKASGREQERAYVPPSTPPDWR
jgi:hypothetical protein